RPWPGDWLPSSRERLGTTSSRTMMRSAVFDLSVELPFARRLINSGRLSTPCSLARFYKSAGEPKRAPLAAGEVALDAPLERNGKRVWLLNQLGKDFALVTLG